MKNLVIIFVLLATLISITACTLNINSDEPLQVNIEQETSTDNATQTEALTETKTYYNEDGFKLQYPAEWIEADGSLWTQEQYALYLEMLEKQKTAPGNYYTPAQIKIQTLERNVTPVDFDLMQYVTNIYGSDENTQVIKINGMEFVRKETTEVYPCQIYYTNNLESIISFTNYNTLTQSEFENILATFIPTI